MAPSGPGGGPVKQARSTCPAGSGGRERFSLAGGSEGGLVKSLPEIFGVAVGVTLLFVMLAHPAVATLLSGKLVSLAGTPTKNLLIRTAAFFTLATGITFFAWFFLSP
jgi:hypothetical protein